MPESLDSGDRKLLIGASVFLVALVAITALLSPPQITGEALRPSSYSPAWNGAKGSFLLLQELGYRVERWEQPPTAIHGDPSRQVLILADPSQPPSEKERFAVRQFLQQGGRVLATGAEASALFPDASSYQQGLPFGEPQTFRALVPSPLARGAPEIRMVAPIGWRPESPAQLVIYGNDDTAAVVNYRVGKGQVIWWAAATPLTNGGIREAGNLALFLNSVGPRSGVRVLWDEYFHGVQDSLWSYLARTPLPWGIAQIGLIFLAILATYSRRDRPIRAPAGVSRLSPLEFVETLGDLYRSGHAGPVAVRNAYQRFRFLLLRQLGLPTSTPAADVARRAAGQLAYEEGPLLDALVRSESAICHRDLPGDEALDLVQQLFDYTVRLEPKRARTPEGSTP